MTSVEHPTLVVEHIQQLVGLIALRQRKLPTLEAICLDIFISRLHDVISNWCLDTVNAQCYSSILLRIVNWFSVDVRILFNITFFQMLILINMKTLNFFRPHELFQYWFQRWHPHPFQQCNSTFIASCSRCLKRQHWS